MNPSGIETLLDRRENDAVFRMALRRDPEGAVKSSGVTLGADEWAALRAIDWS